MKQTASDAIWRALADKSRRRLLDLLRDGPRTTGDLCGAFKLSRFAVMKHLAVLESAGLVVVRRQGRERWNHLNAVPIRQVYERWVKPYAEKWASGLLRFRDYLEAEPQESNMSAKKKTSSDFRVAQVELEVALAATPAKVWSALVNETTKWWPREFCVGQARDFIIEPKLGGRMYEDWGDGAGLMWAQVIGIDPPRSIDLIGHLTAAFGGPATTQFRIAIAGKGKGSVLTVSDTIFGNLSDDKCERTREGWAILFDQALRKHVERSK